MKALPALLALGLASAAAAATGEPERTVIKGARMEVVRKGEATSFTGGVTLTRGNDFMSADRMLNMEKEGVTHAWGRVYLRRRDPERGVRWEAWGDEGVYDSNASSGTLAGGVAVEISESTPSARTTRVWAARAAYDSSKGAVSFTGAPRPGRGLPPWPAGVAPRPRALRRDGTAVQELWGERVVYFETDGRIAAEGGVRARWEDSRGPAR